MQGAENCAYRILLRSWCLSVMFVELQEEGGVLSGVHIRHLLESMCHLDLVVIDPDMMLLIEILRGICNLGASHLHPTNLTDLILGGIMRTPISTLREHMGLSDLSFQ